MPVVYWNTIKIKDATVDNAEDEEKTIPFMKYYTVFNLDQIDGIESPAKEEVENKIQPIDAAEQIVCNMPQRPNVIHSEQRAYYRSTTDTVHMPKMETFNKAEEYYSTLFHEIIHAVGHPSRLDRKEVGHSFFRSADYSKEEMVAEIGSSFLCGEAGIVDATIKNSAGYLDDWLKVLRKEKKFIIEAASKAQKSADFILGK